MKKQKTSWQQRAKALSSMSQQLRSSSATAAFDDASSRASLYRSHRSLRNRGLKTPESQYIVSSKNILNNTLLSNLRSAGRFFHRNRAFAASALLLLGCSKLYKFGSVPIDFGAGTSGPQTPTSSQDGTCTNLEKFPGDHVQSNSRNSSQHFRLSTLTQNVFNYFNSRYIYYYKDLLERGPVFYVWTLFWFRAFQETSIHDALLKLLYGAINEDRFVNAS